MNIAVFGGSFDPFHIGHEAIIKKTLQAFSIHQLFLIPTYLNPDKESSFLNADERLASLYDMYYDNPKIKIIDYEVKQRRKVPTIETILYLISKYPLDIIYLIIGADNFLNLDKWDNFELLQRKVSFIVVLRDGYKTNLQTKEIPHQIISVNIPVSSTSIREKLELNLIPKKLHTRIEKNWKKE